MAQDFLSLLSPAFTKKARRTIGRKQKIVAILDAYFNLPPGGTDEAIAMLRENENCENITSTIIYEDRYIYKLAWEYFHCDDERRAWINTRRTDPEKTEFFGLNCLLGDNPDIQTWEDVQRKLNEVAQNEDGAKIAPPDKMQESDALLSMPSPLDVLIPQIIATREVLQNIEANIRVFIKQQVEQEEHDKSAIAKLQSENAHLRQKLEAVLRQESVAVKNVTDIQRRSGQISHMVLIAQHHLPETTKISSGGWQKELPIRYSEERNGLCDRLRDSDYTRSEKGQFTKAIRLLAQHGSRYPSLRTEVFRRPLPGIPGDVSDFMYSRASENLRFAWKQSEDEVRILGLYKHESGADSSLPIIR